MKEKLYTVLELKGILNLHEKTIIRFIHEDKIKGKKIGRSWMVSESDLRTYVHGELSNNKVEQTNYETLNQRISVSTVIEIKEQNSEEATRISNSLMAMLNSESEETRNTRFDFFYYPEVQTAKYIVYGTPKAISQIIDVFDVLSSQKKT
ncbi:helix-turn-helix domain-containing protein [Sulfurospirillum arcachonense]|uniref:helix-turn-helix domain-containing protein n=1 Tax=Sulfurospirillum arcachonense TaxID=57666 RepID=UPI0004BC58B8|nr:helix-turn-helix domain-containing protein [Sulfurospirillum arcachonense]